MEGLRLDPNQIEPRTDGRTLPFPSSSLESDAEVRRPATDPECKRTFLVEGTGGAPDGNEGSEAGPASQEERTRRSLEVDTVAPGTPSGAPSTHSPGPRVPSAGQRLITPQDRPSSGLRDSPSRFLGFGRGGLDDRRSLDSRHRDPPGVEGGRRGTRFDGGQFYGRKVHRGTPVVPRQPFKKVGPQSCTLTTTEGLSSLVNRCRQSRPYPPPYGSRRRYITVGGLPL